MAKNHLLHIMCHLLPKPIAIVTGPTLANPPTMHSRLVHQDRTPPKKKEEERNYATFLNKGPFRGDRQKNNKQKDIATDRLN